MVLGCHFVTYRPPGMTVAGQSRKVKELPVRQVSWRGERRKEWFMTQLGRPVLGQENAGQEKLDKETVTKAYARWAPVYDLVFGAVFERGRTLAIEAAERIGGRIL